MIVELISVGTELLLGNIVNTNAQYLSETCAKLGLNVYYQTTGAHDRSFPDGALESRSRYHRRRSGTDGG